MSCTNWKVLYTHQNVHHPVAKLVGSPKYWYCAVLRERHPGLTWRITVLCHTLMCGVLSAVFRGSAIKYSSPSCRLCQMFFSLAHILALDSVSTLIGSFCCVGDRPGRT